MSAAAGTAPRRRRVRAPVRMQMEATECGAAALGIVLAHYGRWVPLEELRDECGISRDGSNALSVKKAAERYGLEVVARRCSLEGLKQMEMPAIAYWRFGHFLVVEGWSSDRWYLNDPAMGQRECSHEEMAEAFTGVALQMTPGPDFVKGGKRPRLIARLGAYLTGSRDGVLLMALLGLLLVIPQILIPGVARVFVDWLQGGPQVEVVTLLAALTFAALLQAGLVALQGSVGMRLATKLSIVLQSKMIARLLQLPASFHSQRGAASLAQRALQPTLVASTVSTLFSSMVVGVISSLTAIVLLLLTYPPAGAVALVALAVLITAMILASRKRRSLAMRTVREQVDVASISAVTLGQIEVIKASGAEDHVVAKWTAAHNRFLAANQELGEKTAFVDVLPTMLLVIANIGVTIVGLAGVASGALELSGFVAAQTLLGLALAPAAMVVGQFQAAETLAGELDQIDDVLGTEVPVVEVIESDEVRPARLRGDLRLTDITFGYDKARPALLQGLDLHIPPGARVALVGPSGCGKSTVARLVVGLYDPWQGEILIDGRPRMWWPEQVIHHEVAMVDQDPVIFAGTFRDNITLWDPTIGDAEVLQAAKDACLHDDIARRPGSYEAELRAGGTDLSGGQRQRLEIARALVRDPAIIVLDEATSALDAATEAHIDAAIRRRGASSLVIAHRLSTIRDSDEIIVLDQGLVAERGIHAELVAHEGPYWDLVTA